jgi:hypothetical protein
MPNKFLLFAQLSGVAHKLRPGSTVAACQLSYNKHLDTHASTQCTNEELYMLFHFSAETCGLASACQQRC